MFANLPAAAGPLVTLENAGARLVVAPECGARIASFHAADRDVLRPADEAALKNGFVYGFAAFPLMPYSGPIFGDGFRFNDVWYPLGRNVPTEPTATHGEAWISPWRITARSGSAIHLTMDYAPAAQAFPFAWRGDIDYRLEGESLVIELKLTNRDHRPMPGGLGMHPYFPKPPGTILTFDSTGLWPPDAPEALNLGAGPLEPGLDFRHGQDIGAIVFDRLFEGWDGTATLTMPDGTATRIEGDAAFGKLQLYDAWDYPYICIEPVTNTNDGFNRAAAKVPGHAVIVLEPGRSLAGRISITPLRAGGKNRSG
jgi:aldose 1-epimerase